MKSENQLITIASYILVLRISHLKEGFKYALMFLFARNSILFTTVMRLTFSLECNIYDTFSLNIRWLSFVFFFLFFFSLNLGEIGGQVGLCVGASLLTVLEFIDVIFSMIKIRLGFRWINKKLSGRCTNVVCYYKENICFCHLWAWYQYENFQ